MDTIDASPLDPSLIPWEPLSSYQATWENAFAGTSPFYTANLTPLDSGLNGMGGLSDPFGGVTTTVMAAGGAPSSASGSSVWSEFEYLAIAALVIWGLSVVSRLR